MPATLFDYLRYGIRQLLHNPLHTAVCVLTLALGIGANAAIFSAVYAVLLRPLPFKDARQLVLVHEYKPGNVAKTGSPLTRYNGRATQNTVFSETGGYWDVSGSNNLVFGGAGSVERLQASIVTNSFFSILGVQPEIGRAFSGQDERPGGAKVFLASHALWERALAADPNAIGKSYRLDGEPYTLIGILPADFRFPGNCDIWQPLGTLGAGILRDRVSHQFWMLGRLKPGVTPARAQSELDALQQRFAQAYPATDANWRVRVTPLLDELVGSTRTALWILFAAVGFVLLVACTNVVNLLLAKAMAREREFAIRGALGAQRSHLLRQALAETLLLVTAGGLLGVLFAKIGLGALIGLSAGSLPRLERPELNGAVLAFSAALVLVTTLLVGIAPALHSAGAAFAQSLREGRRSASFSPRSLRFRNALVIVELALTLLLLSGAGLMLRSFAQLRNVKPGFRTDHALTLKITLPDASYRKDDQRAAFLRELLERLNATPGITLAAATDRLPLSGERNWGSINIVGRPLLDSAHAPSVEGRSVSANYFRTLGIPLLRGREFTDADTAAGRRVAIINQTMARQFWPDSDPIGQRLASPYHPTAEPDEIIGIAADIKDFALDAQTPPEIYTPYRWWNVMNIVLRSTQERAAISAVRSQVAALDREVPVYGVASMDDVLNRSIARQRFELLLLGAFAGIALILAAGGIYGVLAFAISRRTQEIGVRMALGATPACVLRLLLAQGMKLVLLGIAAGLAASFWLLQLLRGLLFELSPSDPATLAAVAALLAAVGAFACAIPSRRALQVDPMVALRSE